MASKWTSRKFWTAIVGQMVGIIALVWGASAAEQVEAIVGAVILIASTLGYLKAEGDIDKERTKK